MDLSKKVVVVTGASQGIGESIALEFSKNDCSLVLIGRNIESLEKVSTKCKENGSQTLIIQEDLTKLDAIPNLIEKIKNEFGKINILVNNAGIYVNGNPYESSLRDWDKALTLNIQSPYHLTNQIIHHIPKDEGGAIIFISSIAGKITYKNGGIYCLTKHALSAYANCLFESLRENNVMVSTFYPGFVNTEMGREDHLIPEKMIQPEEFAEQVVSIISSSQSGCVREMTISPRVSPRK